MSKHATCIELRSGSGTVLLTALVYDQEIDVADQHPEAKPTPPTKPDVKPKPSNGNGQATDQGQPGTQQNKSEDPLMTESQKRYLFRLMAGRGIEGNQAYDQLKKVFRVGTLREVTKQEASRVIDRLVKENGRGGGIGHD